MIPGYTPAAKYPVSTLPKHITFSIRPATEFELLIADVKQERVYIVALTLYNPATALEEIVYIASHAFVSDFDQPAVDASIITDGSSASITDGSSDPVTDGS